MFEDLINDEGMYEDSRGVCFNDVAEYLHESKDWCGFCGCGIPEMSLRCIRDCLRLIDDLHSDKTDYDGWATERDKIASRPVMYTLWYMLDRLELTEHGGSVPGWLTDKGHEMLKALEELELDDDL